MKVREEINRFATEENKPVLHWLLDHYHWQSQWNFVALATFEKDEKQKWGRRRVWEPTTEGKVLFEHMRKE